MSDAYDRMQRVSELAKLINGFPFDSSDFASDGDVPLVRIRDVLSEPFETYVPANVVPRNVLLRDDDVVIGMDGDFNSTLWRRGEAALNQRVCALRSVNGTDPRYLAYALPEHLKVINDLTWSTTVKHLTARQVRAIRLPEREAPEQRAIADFLDRETAQIDEFIAENERFIELLTERRAAVIAHALKGYDPTPLKYLVTPTRPMTYGILQCGDHVEGGVPYVGPSDIAGEGSIPAPSALRRTTPEIASEYRRSVLEGGDVVVSIGPAYGRVAVIDETLTGANLTQDTVRVSLIDSKVYPRYLVWVLSSRIARDYWDSLIVGATFRRLNLGQLASTPVPLPSLAEQRVIAERLDERTARIDEALSTAREGIELAKERRSALISAAVTGKIDVTEDAT